MSVIIAGSRDLEISIDLLDSIIKESDFKIEKLLNGLCKTGIDSVALKWASKNNIKTDLYPADWSKFGLSAGPRRNRSMADNATHLIAIYKKGRLGPGTKNMIEEATKRNLTIFIKEI